MSSPTATQPPTDETRARSGGGVGELAVFCDFDGTFSIQDVGSTLARQRLPERRLELWSAYEQGNVTAWEYNVELLDGFELPAAELDAFLGTIELDPGAREMLAWCEKRGVPFQILSDGFDYNLDRLQEIHGIRFDYVANELRYEGERWRIAPGWPDPSCSCGTGICKRAVISAYRRRQPGSFCAHVGNGRVSDLCGARAADLAFAKDSLAEALAEERYPFVAFETLHDVVAELERRVEAKA